MSKLVVLAAVAAAGGVAYYFWSRQPSGDEAAVAGAALGNSMGGTAFVTGKPDPDSDMNTAWLSVQSSFPQSETEFKNAFRSAYVSVYNGMIARKKP